MALKIDMTSRVWPMREPFVVATGVLTELPTLHLQLTASSGAVGRGEACGVVYAGETPATMMAQIRSVSSAIEAGVDCQTLLKLLPPGGARLAVDSALWDLHAKEGGGDPFRLTELQPRPVQSAQTIGIRSIADYEAAGARLAGYALLKIKVDAREPVAAVQAVRRGAPASRFIVDPNQSWSGRQLRAWAPDMARLGVVLLEQPIAVGEEAGLDGYRSPVPLCADELIRDAKDLPLAAGRFQYINIKLDKAGGLTAALSLADAAEAAGLGLMVGCMAGSSLSMAPAMVLAQRCAFADLDGPLLHAEDVDHGFSYVDGRVAEPHNPRLWG